MLVIFVLSLGAVLTGPPASAQPLLQAAGGNSLIRSEHSLAIPVLGHNKLASEKLPQTPTTRPKALQTADDKEKENRWSAPTEYDMARFCYTYLWQLPENENFRTKVNPKYILSQEEFNEVALYYRYQGMPQPTPSTSWLLAFDDWFQSMKSYLPQCRETMNRATKG
ncbi:hypothetical protein IWQ60_007751 [Tieghemiomyces parasiticus]|uniref:Uncharacterized protein n=1 Tax=Tieghemiomyces parasiticus TaxID=78921 RepID=A0A9W7ZWF1_9FUNG|nr:hypothetical protein IWQ60_007751 [Tieghemiomyces parasiticus]